MLRKIGYGLFCVSMLIGANGLAMNNQLSPNTTMEYVLTPNEPQVFINYWYGTINATCTINAQDASDIIFVEGLNKTGKINGNSLQEGQNLTVVVHPNDKLYISAESGAKVRLTNRGAHVVTARCST